MECALETSGVTKAYSTFFLGPINLRVPYGKVVGLVGENGAGKTTYMSILLRQIKRDRGTVRLFGFDADEHDIACKKSVGFVIDECCFHECLTALNVHSVMRGIYEEWDQKQFTSLLSHFDLDPKKKIAHYSKGMKSKLMLAVALSHKPKLLVLDEITSGLDPIVRDEMMMLLRKNVSESGASVLFSTHVTSDLDKVADEVALLHEGKLVFHESLTAMRRDYRIIKCSMAEYSAISKEHILRVVLREGACIALQRGESIFGNALASSAPSVEDLMLLYIKGESVCSA